MKNSKIKNYLEKLQGLTDKQKKIVLWTIVAILGIIMGYFWIRSASDKLNKIGENIGQIKLPEIQTPSVEILAAEAPADQIAEPALSEVEGWQTYINTEYGFEIKYPRNWTLNTKIPKEANRIVFMAVNYSKNPQPQFFDFEINILSNPERLSSKDFVQKLLTKNLEQDIGKIIYKTATDLTMGGLSAYELGKVFAYDQNQDQIFISKQSFILKITFPSAEENTNLQDPINNNGTCQKMISTFKFIK